jgi:hypothetical protein
MVGWSADQYWQEGGHDGTSSLYLQKLMRCVAFQLDGIISTLCPEARNRRFNDREVVANLWT